MNSILIMIITFACIFGCAMIGFLTRRLLQDHYRSPPSLEVIKLSAGIVATMTALVLGLLVASTKAGFDTKAGEVRTFVVNVDLMDRTMRLYVPSLAPERKILASFVQAILDRVWANDPSKLPPVDVLALMEEVRQTVRGLDVQSAGQKFLQARIMALSDTLMLASKELLDEGDASIPVLMLVVVVIWLSAIFFGFGLIAPFSLVTSGALAIGAAAISMSIFLIVEMDTPFNGYIAIPAASMERALAEIQAAPESPPPKP